MGSATNRNPVRRLDDASTLAGLLEFRPRTTVVLVLLTLMVAVVGWRIARDTGARRIDVLAREAIGMIRCRSVDGNGHRAAGCRGDGETVPGLRGRSHRVPAGRRRFRPRRGPQGDVGEPPGGLVAVPLRGRGVSSRGFGPGPAPQGILRRGVPGRVVRLGGAGRQVLRPVGEGGSHLHRRFGGRRDKGVRPGPSTVHLIRNRTEYAKEGLQ